MNQNSLQWLYIDFNSYFASVEQQLCPELRGKPVIVVPVETDATCAIAASYEAKALGIKTNTPVYEARRKCPNLQVVLARHDYYVDFHHRIRDEVEKHLPVTMVCSIDEVACRLLRNEAAPEKATAIAKQIKQGLAQHVGEYIRCSIGIAPNRYLAKVATELQKPDGLVVLQAEDLPHRLYTLQLRDLPGIGANMEARLKRACIADMPALLALEAKALRSLWGSVWGERLYHYLRGVDVPESETTRSSVGHSHVLAPELREPAQARLVARRLLLKAASRLRRLGFNAKTLLLAARLEDGRRLEVEIACPAAQDNFTLLHGLEAGWQQLHRTLRAGTRIRKVSVTLVHLQPIEKQEPELLDLLPDSAREKRARGLRLSHAMDRLNQKYGRDSVLLGLLPHQGKSFSGTKVAFTRIPDLAEFAE